MPTYQYACTECGHQFEQFQSFSDDALTECPQCSGRLRKLFNAVGVVFKGSGFYRNDSRAASTSTDAPAKPAEKTGEKTSEKTAAKSTEKAASAAGSSSSSSGSSTGSTSSS